MVRFWPSTGKVRGKHQLKKAEMGDAVGRDNLAQKPRGGKAPVWVADLNSLRWLVAVIPDIR
jgi:hypothetical protein